MEISLAAEFCKVNCFFGVHRRQCYEDRASAINSQHSIFASTQNRNGSVANLGGKNDDT
jgi:hypothetical protein